MVVGDGVSMPETGCVAVTSIGETLAARATLEMGRSAGWPSIEVEVDLLDKEGTVMLQPVKLLARRMIKKNNTAVVQVLIQWAHLPVAEAACEDYYQITNSFLT
ncbi:hypothetical protein BUALT_Bualt18G0000100 [Buddleja alternifolia]|uniref:Uncharacterized protein n=1 Tax=Buddleja alternifolia TaxID=168488 RepID=A0AAV6W3Q9_9LAMI|nr:hypothetical protein BUALT_Bualt18G0000100 [Buddleja alternifolia]